MSKIKETTLHPDGNNGVDLYPKTNINQVQELPQKLTSVENQIYQLNIDKLTKPTTPTAESAVTLLADGTVGTKPLSEIGGGGGGKLYEHLLDITFHEIGSTGLTSVVYSSSGSPMSSLPDNGIIYIFYNGWDGKGIGVYEGNSGWFYCAVFQGTPTPQITYYEQSVTVTMVSDTVIEV